MEPDPQEDLIVFTIHGIIMAALFAALAFCTGCTAAQANKHGVGTWTEAYTAFHKVEVDPAKPVDQLTPVEVQALANNACYEPVMQVRLPDNNFAWKYPKGQTMCVAAVRRQECTCKAERTPGLLVSQTAPNWARVYFKRRVVEMFW